MNLNETSTVDESMTITSTKKNFITFAALKPRTQLPITCRPQMDSSGKLFTGQGKHGYFEVLTRDEKDNLPFIFDYETAYVVEDGKTLNLSDPFDAAIWVWLQRHPYIAENKASCLNSNDAVYYIMDVNKEAEEYLKKTERVDEARPAVRKISEADRVRVASALGLTGAEGFSPEQVLTWLLRKADSDPEAVLSSINPENKMRLNATIFFKKVLQHRIVERMEDGVYYFGGKDGVAMGHTEELAIDYLLTGENSQRVQGMRAMLAEKTKAAVGITD